MALKRSPAARLLKIYLQDHYAGATAGVALFRRAATSRRGDGAGPEIARLATEIAEDRQALREMMRSVRVRPAVGKAALAWAAERAGRIKPNGRLARRSPLSDVVELEGLLLAVNGKINGWQSLREVAEGDGRLEGSALQTLLRRADEQQERLLEIHRRSARSTFR